MPALLRMSAYMMTVDLACIRVVTSALVPGFGIGSMVYSGLEFGQYFAKGSNCEDTLLVLRSGTRMVLTLMQIQFMFLNNRVRSSKQQLSKAAVPNTSHLIPHILCISLNYKGSAIWSRGKTRNMYAEGSWFDSRL
jgi:hypothetical protein